MLQLVESGRYDTREDFSVVLQPFFLNTRLPILEVCSPASTLGFGGRTRREFKDLGSMRIVSLEGYREPCRCYASRHHALYHLSPGMGLTDEIATTAFEDTGTPQSRHTEM